MSLILSRVLYLQVISMHLVNHLNIISNHFLTFIYLFNFKLKFLLFLILVQEFTFIILIFFIVVKIF